MIKGLSVRSGGLAVLAVGALAIPAALPAGAAASTTIALWQMDEPSGSTVLHDSSGYGVNGQIGTSVHLGGNAGGVSFFNWSYKPPNQPPADPQRLLQIDDNRLNPGTRDYAISFRYRTTHGFGNIVQKGQATTPGGQVKVELPNGVVTCLYRGADGRRAIKSRAAYNNGSWHTVRCERTSSAVVLTVYDSAGKVLESRTINGLTGNLSNSFPVTVGGKVKCDQTKVTCDYFSGDIDWVRVEAG